VRKTYQGMPSKSKPKLEVLGNRELLVEMPLPMVEVWEELQAQVEQLTGHAGLRMIGTILEDEALSFCGVWGVILRESENGRKMSENVCCFRTFFDASPLNSSKTERGKVFYFAGAHAEPRWVAAGRHEEKSAPISPTFPSGLAHEAAKPGRGNTSFSLQTIVYCSCRMLMSRVSIQPVH